MILHTMDQMYRHVHKQQKEANHIKDLFTTDI